MTTFKYLPAIAGAGKTESAIKHAIENAKKGEKVLFLQPTIALINQTQRRIQEQGYSTFLYTITSESQEGSATKSLNDTIDQADTSSGTIVQATHAAWQRLQRGNMSEWSLIADEPPSAFSTTSINAKRSHEFLTKHLELGEARGDGYALLKPNKKESGLARLHDLRRDAEHDDALARYADATQPFINGMTTYVNHQSYLELINGESHRLMMYHVITPRIYTGFKSVLLMSANFEDTEMYRIWSRLGVKFEPVKGLGGQELPTEHSPEVCKRIKIYYLVDRWSLAAKSNYKYRKIYEDECIRAVTELIGDQKFIYAINTGDRQSLFKGFPNGTQVKPMAHGLNEYRDRDHAVMFFIANHSVDRTDFLQKLFGIPFEEGMNMINTSAYYQFVCRTSLRETPAASSSRHNIIIVMDKSLAETLHAKFPGSKLIQFESEKIASIVPERPGPKPSGVSDAERMKMSRAKKKEEDLARKTAILMGLDRTSDPEGLSESCSELPYNKNNEHSGQEELAYSCIATIYSEKIEEGKKKDFEEFVEFLRKKSEDEVTEKDAVVLINTTSFKKEDGVPIGRKAKDVESASAIWLDMDEGNTDPDDFAKCFKGIEMVIYSSFNSKDDDKRWRAIIPVSRKVNQKEYNQIAKDVHTIALEAGYVFDKTKKQPSDFFYVPCHPVGSDHHVFEHYASDERKKLDVDEWLYSETKTTKVDDSEPGSTLTISSTIESDSEVTEEKKKEEDAPDDRKSS